MIKTNNLNAQELNQINEIFGFVNFSQISQWDPDMRLQYQWWLITTALTLELSPGDQAWQAPLSATRISSGFHP